MVVIVYRNVEVIRAVVFPHCARYAREATRSDMMLDLSVVNLLCLVAEAAALYIVLE